MYCQTFSALSLTNSHSRLLHPRLKQGVLFGLTLSFATLLLSGCGGGGSSQEDDPVLVDTPIIYVKRAVPIDVDDEDNDGNITEVVPYAVVEPADFHPGAALYLRARATPSATETNITDRAWPEDALYDVKDVSVSHNGELVVFAMRAPDDPDINDPLLQPKWDIWEYEIETDILRRLISSDTTAQEAHDVAPAYLPNGNIVFSSDRQQTSKAILLDDGKPRFSALREVGRQDGNFGFVLHTMDSDGNNIDQITFNQSHDLMPTVLDNGRVLFLRWDGYGRNNLSLYTVNPDGSDLQFYYGFHSQDTGSNATVAVFDRPREMPDGRIVVNLKPRVDDRYGGDLVIIDGANFTEIDQPTAANAGAAGPGQASALPRPPLVTPIDMNRPPSVAGHYNSAYPFFDGSDRWLVTYNQCRLISPLDPEPTTPTLFVPCTDENVQPDAITGDYLQEGPPQYGLWIYNASGGTQVPLLVAQPGIIYSDVAVAEIRTRPAVIPSLPPANEAVGVVHIRSVYDLDGVDTAPGGIATTANPGSPNFATRPARFLRILKAVSEPDDDVLDFNNEAFGFAGAERMKEILGYVPIEPDGSVKFQVPANVAFTIEVLNASLGRINPRHRNWLQVRPGETLQCNGCHTAGSELPHGRRDAEAASVNLGAVTTGQPFPNTDVTLFAEIGETMAETYERIDPQDNGGVRAPNFNIIYTDEWTDPLNLGLTPDADILLKYSDADPAIGLNTTPPVGSSCQNNWAPACRATINYLLHIQPIWNYAGRVNDAMEPAVCTSCHAQQGLNGVGQMVPQIPAGQLELTSDPISPLNQNANQRMTWVVSFLDIFENDYELTLDAMGNLIRRLVTTQVGVDDMGNPILQDLPQVVQSPINSGNFVAVFQPGGAHDGGLTRLSPHELKLISEWLSIGAQYYNNPFQAPLN